MHTLPPPLRLMGAVGADGRRTPLGKRVAEVWKGEPGAAHTGDQGMGGGDEKSARGLRHLGLAVE